MNKLYSVGDMKEFFPKNSLVFFDIKAAFDYASNKPHLNIYLIDASPSDAFLDIKQGIMRLKKDVKIIRQIQG